MLIHSINIRGMCVIMGGASGMEEQQGLQWIERMKAERDLPDGEL